jgi:hypothetical protein
VIIAVNRTPVRSAQQAGELLERRRGVMRVYFERAGQVSFVDLVMR